MCVCVCLYTYVCVYICVWVCARDHIHAILRPLPAPNPAPPPKPPPPPLHPTCSTLYAAVHAASSAIASSTTRRAEAGSGGPWSWGPWGGVRVFGGVGCEGGWVCGCVGGVSPVGPNNGVQMCGHGSKGEERGLCVCVEVRPPPPTPQPCPHPHPHPHPTTSPLTHLQHLEQLHGLVPGAVHADGAEDLKWGAGGRGGGAGWGGRQVYVLSCAPY